MDYRRENKFSSENVVQVVLGNSGNSINENGVTSFNDQAVWATEEDYRMWNGESSFDPNSNYDGRLSQSQSGSERLLKRPRNSQSGDSGGSNNRSKTIGKMFYKTKLCCKFRAGTCPYITNCNFAHSNEELRKPPPNWQEIVAAHDEDRAVVSSEPREEFQIPILGVNDEAQRSHKGRHCKKFYTEEGCPYGESCTFLHDEQSKARESVAISLGPGSGGGGYGSNGNGSSTLKPSNWKTRICNKWELTGYCPFGSKCHFAHGTAELLRYGGGAMDGEVKDSPTCDGKQAAKTSESVVASMMSGAHPDGYHMGVPSQRLLVQKTGLRLSQKWKGPDKISKIYGDWIDDLE